MQVKAHMLFDFVWLKSPSETKNRLLATFGSLKVFIAQLSANLIDCGESKFTIRANTLTQTPFRFWLYWLKTFGRTLETIGSKRVPKVRNSLGIFFAKCRSDRTQAFSLFKSTLPNAMIVREIEKPIVTFQEVFKSGEEFFNFYHTYNFIELVGFCQGLNLAKFRNVFPFYSSKLARVLASERNFNAHFLKVGKLIFEDFVQSVKASSCADSWKFSTFENLYRNERVEFMYQYSNHNLNFV
jgi:hypothetical protein